MSCYRVCVRQYLKHQEKIQEYSYSQLFARKTLVKSIFTAKMNCWINSRVSHFDVKQARKHASNGKAGMPIEPGHYSRKKLSDAQIKHFLYFRQYGEVMQDVASGTRSVKLSIGRRATILNAVRMVHKAEIINQRERTLWNILKNCPASQRKSLPGLDNMASEGSDVFDELISICKSVKNEELESLAKDEWP